MGSEYYFSGNPFARAGYPMPNCTTYVYGRAWEILGQRPTISGGDAHTFWTYNLRNQVYAYGQEPQLGAIVCWNSGMYGHVAIVEDIQGDRILISESIWLGVNFQTRWINKKTASLQGYIYLADFSEKALETEFNKIPENKDFVARLLNQEGDLALSANGKTMTLEDAETATNGQYWRFTLGEDGYYEVRNANGFVMDVAGAIDRDGTSIQLDELRTSTGQRWSINAEDEGFTLKPQFTKRLLSLVNDTDVMIFDEKTADAAAAVQVFTMDRLEVPELQVKASPLTNIVSFSIDSELDLPTDAYLKIYKDEYGKGSAIIEPISSSLKVNLTLDSADYEVCLESGAGQALCYSNIATFSLTDPKERIDFAENELSTPKQQS